METLASHSQVLSHCTVKQKHSIVQTRVHIYIHTHKHINNKKWLKSDILPEKTINIKCHRSLFAFQVR